MATTTNSKSRIAYTQIKPFSFIAGQPGTILGARQATSANTPILGVGPEWTNLLMGTKEQILSNPSGYPAAEIGDPIRVYEAGEDALIMVGTGQTVSPDQFLTSDASGYARPVNLATTTVEWVGARAIEGGTAGDIIRCSVVCFPYRS
jgi:hypothetical protein